MSMAAGEYVSVNSQADTQNADLARERKELAADPNTSTPSSLRSTCSAASSLRWPPKSRRS